MARIRGFFILVLVTMSTLWLGAFAQAEDTTAQSPKQSEQEREFQATLEDMQKVAQAGPTIVLLNEHGTLRLPEGYVFVPQPQAARFMRAIGNIPNPSQIGLILPQTGSDGWLATVSFVTSGYIKDEEAKNWDADALLNHLREGTKQNNLNRKARGFPELELKGWIEKPHYDAAKQHLIWSAHVHATGEPDNQDSVNYNTYALGREGYFSINFITEINKIEQQKPVANKLLDSLIYNAGKSYADYNPASDKVAEYGIAALVGGFAAKKLGVLAIIGAFLLKTWKFALIALIAGGGLIGRLFRRN